MRFPLEIFAFLLLIALDSCKSDTTRVTCPLEWISDSHGSIPSNPIPCDPVSHEDFVGRVYYKRNWVPARVVPTLGKAFIPLPNGTSITSDTYDILTTPPYCVLSWVDAYGGHVPLHGIAADTNLPNPLAYVGRAKDPKSGQFVCGSIDLDNSALLAPKTNGSSLVLRSYSALTSVYPEIHVRLSRFAFDLMALNYSSNRSEIIGQEEVKLNPHQITPSISHKVNHFKELTEEFVFTEVTGGWKGLSTLSMNFPLFYGTSDVVLNFTRLDELEPELMITRPRTVQVTSDFQATGNAQQDRHVEICSIVTFIEDQDILFFSEITYRSETLRDVELEKVLTALGRTFTPRDPNKPSKTIKGYIWGGLSGKWAIHTSWYAGYPSEGGDFICSGYVP